ncbi:hypothetical protein EIP73_05380 [Xylella fastidiosa subsp. pauca]|uniref:hypothetical protein n=1 Tax=Xylella fastidiosa TaxID=2371 RepID=UPI001121B834|nr:hypothetical protein [Xylella fastidiosa]TNW22429.1 hypothetical protein EIP73_05380 [Xylella fastidiosa subsp. pauca]
MHTDAGESASSTKQAHHTRQDTVTYPSRPTRFASVWHRRLEMPRLILQRGYGNNQNGARPGTTATTAITT